MGFYKYVRSKGNIKESVGHLLNEEGNQIIDDAEKAKA